MKVIRIRGKSKICFLFVFLLEVIKDCFNDFKKSILIRNEFELI